MPVNSESSAMVAPVRNSHHDSKLSRGNITSLAPIWMGKKKLPSDADRPGMTKRKKQRGLFGYWIARKTR